MSHKFYPSPKAKKSTVSKRKTEREMLPSAISSKEWLKYAGQKKDEKKRKANEMNVYKF